jgi:uncharacterized membrane protein YbhN (UPF0104 family)
VRLVIRLTLSVVMLAVLVWRIPDFDISELFPTFTASTAWWLVGAGATLLAAFALQTLRWGQVLIALGPRPRWPRLFNEFLAGQFLSNLLPAAIGGDVVRIARLGRDLDDYPVAFASVALERLTGWVVLPMISIATILSVDEFRTLGAVTVVALGISVGTLAALVGILAVASNRRWSGVARTATGWRRWIGAVHLGLVSIRRQPASVTAIIAAGSAFQIVQCLAVWMAARALELPEVTALAALAFFPPTAIAQNLPVGFGGLGVREGGFVFFFGALGASEPRAIALGLVTYLLTVATSAVGAPAFLLGGWRAEVREPSVRRTRPSGPAGS